jgi:arginyl-tRNA synthetase
MFRRFRDSVEAALADALAARGWPSDDLGIEEPPEGVDAALASSVAFRIAEEAGAGPPQIAAKLAGEIDPAEYEYIGSVSAQGPYVNVETDATFDRETLIAAQSEEYGHLESSGESIVVEHTSANPTGPIHVGRARNPIVGDAVANLLAAAGHDVDRHYYVNDAGRQLAVFTWAYEHFDEEDLDAVPERERPDYDLVRYYRRGNDYLETADPDRAESAEAEVQAIMQGLEAGETETYERVHEVVDQVLAGMCETLQRLPAEFDEFVEETRFLRDGSVSDLIDRLRELDAAVFEEEAWQLDLAEYDIEKQLVFTREDGTSLYATRDLAHHQWKLEGYDRAVTVLGEDHKLQAEQVRATLDLLGHDTDRVETVHYSWVTLPDGGMSTREGTGIDLDDLLDEAIDRARAEVEDRLEDRLRDDDLTEADVDRIAEQVGIGAVRYDVVSTQPSKGITFEFERALDFEAQSAPYVQYVHARCCGIVAEATTAGVDVPALEESTAEVTALERPEAAALLETVSRFPAVVEDAAAERTPHAIATYTRELAEAFNAFYRECPVLDAEGDLQTARLALVVATRNAMANALGILGVAAPESM